MPGLPGGFAPAKVNLALHVLGRRDDGYHELDSLVVFAGIGDQLTALGAPALSLAVEGPFSTGVPTGEDNLVLKAARTLQAARGVTVGAKMKLTKSLPHAAGLGSASSDAAAAIRLLATLWGVPPLTPEDPETMALGADVPVCLAAPAPQRMSGAGERLAALPPLPAAGLVLVNPGVAVGTKAVFEGLGKVNGTGLADLRPGITAEGLAAWIEAQRNDLAGAAEALAPEIGRALSRLRAQPGVLAAQMSGSGATCFGITRDVGVARQAARAIQLAEQGWWVVPAPLLS